MMAGKDLLSTERGSIHGAHSVQEDSARPYTRNAQNPIFSIETMNLTMQLDVVSIDPV
jgi:hypothetical protein